MTFTEKVMAFVFGSLLGIALGKGDFDKAVKITDKCVRVRCIHTGHKYEDSQKAMLECFENNDDIDFRNMAAIYRQKYCNRVERPEQEDDAA